MTDPPGGASELLEGWSGFSRSREAVYYGRKIKKRQVFKVLSLLLAEFLKTSVLQNGIEPHGSRRAVAGPGPTRRSSVSLEAVTVRGEKPKQFLVNEKLLTAGPLLFQDTYIDKLLEVP